MGRAAGGKTHVPGVPPALSAAYAEGWRQSLRAVERFDATETCHAWRTSGVPWMAHLRAAGALSG